MDEKELPEEIISEAAKAIREGVALRYEGGVPTSKAIRERKLRAIAWRSQFSGMQTDPNKLAEVIIDKVEKRIELDLDGHKYWIEPQ